MDKVVYTGPDEQINRDIQHAPLEHGQTYEVNAGLADRLIESSPHFERVGSPSKDELVAQAAELGIEGASKLTKQKLIAAIAEAKAAADSGGISSAGEAEEVSADA